VICERCKKEIELNNKQIQDRKSFGLKTNLCMQCFNAVKRRKQLNFPEEILYIKGDKQHPLSYNIYYKYKHHFTDYSKIYVEFTCKKCHKHDMKQIRKLKTRIYGKDMNLCTSCVASHNAKNRSNTPKILKPRILKNTISLEEQNILRKVFGKNNALRGFYKGVYFANASELDFLYEHSGEIRNCTLFEKYINP
jgi:hypothetical protein